MAQFQRKCDDNLYAAAELSYYNLDLKNWKLIINIFFIENEKMCKS